MKRGSGISVFSLNYVPKDAYDALRLKGIELARMIDKEYGKTFTSESGAEWEKKKRELTREILTLAGEKT